MAKKYKCRVEYLESTGTQWIDTGIAPSNITPIAKLKFIPTQQYSLGNYGIFGCFGANNNRFQIFYNSIGIGTYVSKSWQVNTTYEVELNGKTPSATINGTVETSGYSNANGFSSDNMYLFTRNNGNVADNGVALKLYYCKIWNNEVLVRDFIPVLDNSGRPAMYDQVSGQLFYNQGTGEFTYGRQIIPVEYLESTDTQWIDSGVPMENISKIECIVDWTNHHTTRRDIAGGGASGSYSFEVSADGYYGLGYNNRSNVQPSPKDKLTWSWGGENTYPKLYINDSLVCTDTLLRIPTGTFKTAITSAYVPYCKFYSIKIYNFSNVLVQDFIPCIDENLTPFMFDNVNCTVYLNAGTGQFKVGPNVEKAWGGKKLRRKLALAIANLKKKRKYYCEVEYLESTGTQWIDTGINVDTSTDEIKLYFELTETQNYKWFFGEYDNNARLGLGSGDGVNKRNFLYQQSATKVSDTQMCNTQHLFEINSNGGFLDGTKIRDYLSFASTSDIYLFNLNIDSPSDYRCKSKIWRYEHKRNGVLVRDFIPVLDWDMTPCMYDRVTEQLFYNAGTGEFKVGRQIHYVDYLESTGTQYIDMGIGVKENTVFKAIFSIASSSAGYSYFGARNSTNERFQIVNSIGIGGGYYLVSSIYPIANQKYEIEMHASGEMYLDGVKRNATNGTFSQVSFERNLWLFATNYYDSSVPPGASTFWKAQVFEGDTLVRDFIPMVDELGVGAMFDRVTHTIFDNKGTGAGFNYPPVELEYLESTGVEYIDTGIKFDCANTKIEVKTYEDSLTRIHSICGDDGNIFYYFRGTGNWAVGYNASASNIDSYMVVGDNIFVIDKNNVYLNGVLAKTYTASSTVSSHNALLFNRKTNRPDSGAVTMYYCKIWNNNTLVRDYIPCYKDGVLGMWDKANSVFYGNVGTGTFTTSKIVESKYE